MLFLIVAGSILASLLNPGATVAMGGLTYTIANSGVMPVIVVPLLALMPAGWLAWLLFRRQLQPAWMDLAFALVVAVRVASILQVDWLDGELRYDVMTFLVAALVYYPLGRVLLAGGVEPTRAALAFTAAMLVVFPIYWLSPNLTENWDRTVLGDASAVGLSQALTVAGVVTSGWLAVAARPSLSHRHRLALVLGVLVLFYALFPLILANGSRGSLAAVILTICLALVHLLRLRNWLSLAVAVLATVTAVQIVGIDTSWIDPSTRLGRFALIILSQVGSSDVAMSSTSDSSLLYRVEVQAWARQAFQDSPVLGCGYGCVAAHNSHGYYAHNMFLEAAADGGLLLLAPLAAVMAVATFWALRNLWLSRTPGVIVFSMLFLGLLIHFQVSFTMSHGRILFFALGAVVSSGLRLAARERPPAVAAPLHLPEATGTDARA